MLPLAIAAAAAIAGGPAATVQIKDIAFKPQRLEVKRGTTVTWRFLDEVARHNVHSVGRRAFKSSRDQIEGTYSVRFRRAGTYRYVCTLHPGMDGRVVVRRGARAGS